jgi:hypothetical protein
MTNPKKEMPTSIMQIGKTYSAGVTGVMPPLRNLITMCATNPSPTRAWCLSVTKMGVLGRADDQTEEDDADEHDANGHNLFCWRYRRYVTITHGRECQCDKVQRCHVLLPAWGRHQVHLLCACNIDVQPFHGYANSHYAELMEWVLVHYCMHIVLYGASMSYVNGRTSQVNGTCLSLRTCQ